MMLLHAFQEKQNKDKNLHLRNWLGYPVDDNRDVHEDGSYIACHCGGRIVPLSKLDTGEFDVAAIWHKRSFRELDESE